MRQQVHHAGQDGEAGPPAVALVARPELDPDAERLARVCAAFDERNGGLGDDEREVLLQAGAQAAAMMGQFVAVVAQVDPDVAVDDLGREGRYVVRPQVEGAAGGQVEAGVMPVAGEDAVVDAAAIEGEAHVGAAVVQGVYAIAVTDEHQGAVTRAHPVADTGGEIAQTPGVGESIGGHWSSLRPCGLQYCGGWPRLTKSATGTFGSEAIVMRAGQVHRPVGRCRKLLKRVGETGPIVTEGNPWPPSQWTTETETE